MTVMRMSTGISTFTGSTDCRGNQFQADRAADLRRGRSAPVCAAVARGRIEHAPQADRSRLAADLPHAPGPRPQADRSRLTLAAHARGSRSRPWPNRARSPGGPLAARGRSSPGPRPQAPGPRPQARGRSSAVAARGPLPRLAADLPTLAGKILSRGCAWTSARIGRITCKQNLQAALRGLGFIVSGDDKQRTTNNGSTKMFTILLAVVSLVVTVVSMGLVSGGQNI
jgi:hypothetical protein